MTIPGQNPLAYEGVSAQNPPNGVLAKSAPTANTLSQAIGTIWINTLTNIAYMLVNISSGAAVWDIIGDNTTGVATVPQGGTGDSTLTAHGVLIGEGVSPVNVTAAGTTGQVLTATTSADPAFAAIGTNSGLTAHGVLVAEGTGAFAATAVGATGTLLAGATGADPAFTASPSVTGSVTAGTTLTATLGNITATNGNLSLGTAGNKLLIATGSNASVGTTAALSGTPGTIVVSTTAVTAASKIFLSVNTPGGSQGFLSAPTASIVANTSFVINSTANETSTVDWLIIN